MISSLQNTIAITRRFQINMFPRTKISDTTPSARSTSTEEQAGFLSKLNFAWLSPLMKESHRFVIDSMSLCSSGVNSDIDRI